MRFISKLWLTVVMLCSCFSAISATKYGVKVLTDALDTPWAMEVTGEQTFLISERSGALRIFSEAGLSAPLKNLPDIYYKGQGGLLDIALHPDFAANQELFVSYASGNDNANTLVISRARLNVDARQLENVTPVLRVAPDRDTPVHYGGRMAVLPDNTLLISSGDGFDYRESAQRMDSLMGKILRINFDGSPAKDNPFANSDNEFSRYIWTLGHRNPQALLFDKVTSQVIAHEHGPAGGDEINILEAGKNYGWPVITNGKDYSGASISPFKSYPGMEQPWFDWTPSVAPSDMILYRGDQFPALNSKLLVTTLKSMELLVVGFEAGNAEQQEALLTDVGERLRGIQQDPEGNIYLLTDSGKLLRLLNQ